MTTEQGSEWIYGLHPVLEALERPEVIERCLELLVLENSQHRSVRQAQTAARRAGLKVKEVSGGALQRVCGAGANHQGVALQVGAFAYADADALMAKYSQPAPEHRRVLVLDQLQDSRNVGALLRSAVAFGFEAVLMPKDRSAPISAEAVKASVGAALKIPVGRVTNLARTLDGLKEGGFWIYGAAGEGTATPEQVDWKRSVALVLGAEGDGLRALTRKQCDVLIRIPQRAEVESLNVSVAGGLC